MFVGYITEKQAKDASRILVASSVTYIASSLLAALSFWPWMGWFGPMRLNGRHHRSLASLFTSRGVAMEHGVPSPGVPMPAAFDPKSAGKAVLAEDLTKAVR